jgi:NAD(P)-dependent dehydrogenase (short-subunit alcohol dehydrogenase family)
MRVDAGDRSRVALVTGANRGIGLEVCRQLAAQGWIVLLGSRDAAKGVTASRMLAADDLSTRPVQLDVRSVDDAVRLAQVIEADYGRLDALVNNAAILYDDWQRPSNANLDEALEAFETNTLAPWRLVQTFLPLLRKSQHPRIVNVSSEAGSIAEMGVEAPAYNVSKAALNALTKMLSLELRRPFVVNAICPGWTNTDMGKGGRPVSEGAAGVVWAVNLPDDGPTGGFFQDGRALPW